MSTWICDIDGTLALRGVLGRGPFDWARVGEDTPNHAAIEIVQALIAAGHEIRYVTGRMEQCRDLTVDWLRKHVMSSTLPTDLYMRPDGDFTPDNELKRKIYGEQIFPYCHVTGVIDDRDKVVRMWREELGLTCIQVAAGNF